MDRLGMDIEELESLQKMLIRVIEHAKRPHPTVLRGLPA
jgi:hypothetical protein